MFQLFLYDTNNGWYLDDLNPSATATVPLSEDEREDQFSKYCLAGASGNGHGCFGKILNDNWEMNY